MEPEKATVTNPPVPEPGDKGKMSKEDENRIRENLRAEYNREATDLSEKLTAVQAEKEELESRVNQLTNAEKSRLSQLDDQQRVTEAQLQELETKPEYAGYREKITRETRKAKEEAVSDSAVQTSKILMQDFIDRKAEEEKITPKQLRDELNARLKFPGSERIKYPDLLPYERAKAAYAERSENKRIQQIEDENKRLKAERDGFSEEGTRVPSETRTHEQLRESAISGDKSAALSLSKDLDKRQAEYEANLRK